MFRTIMVCAKPLIAIEEACVRGNLDIHTSIHRELSTLKFAEESAETEISKPVIFLSLFYSILSM